jgi:hypothetical protein
MQLVYYYALRGTETLETPLEPRSEGPLLCIIYRFFDCLPYQLLQILSALNL